ncbi:MAG: hypothetical protein ACI9LM_001387 [Alteromonadaceae bacterium]|jgi:hypothetical protein
MQVKNTSGRQIFILNIDQSKLVVEFMFLNKVEKGDSDFSPKHKWIMDVVLSPGNACGFPLIFNNAYYLMIIRPFANADFLENAL